MEAGGYAQPLPSTRTPALFGHVMGARRAHRRLRDARRLPRPQLRAARLWFIAWLPSLGCLVGLNVANSRGNTGLALGLLLAFGVLIGASVSTTVNYYAQTDPTAVRQAFGATALFVGGLAPAATRSAATCRSSTGSRSGCCSL